MTDRNVTAAGSQRARRIDTPTFKRLFTLKEAAEYLGRSHWGMRDLIWKGLIPVVKGDGARKIFVDLKDLDAYIDRNKSVYR